MAISKDTLQKELNQLAADFEHRRLQAMTATQAAQQGSIVHTNGLGQAAMSTALHTNQFPYTVYGAHDHNANELEKELPVIAPPNGYGISLHSRDHNIKSSTYKDPLADVTIRDITGFVFFPFNKGLPIIEVDIRLKVSAEGRERSSEAFVRKNKAIHIVCRVEDLQMQLASMGVFDE